ncbi:nucleotidyltransferase [Blautia sp.]|jgi:predicted nucleotidyltransferase|uniref:nucleotidyltransferase n=1 Tax=Blautia sp. TaxID=1955243 RepID=UPI003D8D407D
MNVTGIIAEYNPFHMGHLHQIKYIKETLQSDYIVIAMSGDFVQRGAPGLLPKHIRAEMALRCGADLVLELPVQFSSASAEFFAHGGVSLLNGLGVVDQLCFGSEEGNTEGMLLAARILNQEPAEYQTLLQTYLKQGMSFPAARSKALNNYLLLLPGSTHQTVSPELLSSPNNILGIEYCRAILSLNSHMKPVTLKRKGNDYHENTLSKGQLPSASAIRSFLQKAKDLSPVGEMLPEPAFELLQKAFLQGAYVTEDDLDLLLHYKLLSSSAEELAACADLSPQLADRIRNQLNHYQGFAQFAEHLKTKELTRTRIQRALLHLLLNIKETPREAGYCRILGFRKDSAPLLSEIKKNSSLPLITKMADAKELLLPKDRKLLDTNTEASNIYESILCHKTGRAFRHEYQKQIVIFTH